MRTLTALLASARGSKGQRSTHRRLLTLATAMSAIVLCTSIVLSFWGCRFLVVTPLLAVSLSAALLAVTTIAQIGVDRLLYASTLQLYLAPQVIERIVSGVDKISLGASHREVSVLVSDLEGFSGLLASLKSEAFVQVLNGYFAGILDILCRHGAMLDKMTGDGVIALFGAPHIAVDHAERAVACSRDLARFGREYSDRMRRSGIAFGRTRLGISSGNALVGNFGSHCHFNYTAYGEVVVVASRLETENKTLGTSTLISEATYRSISNVENVTFIGDLSLKGVPRSTRAYSVG